MNGLQPVIFLVPIIALTLVIVLYSILLKKVKDKICFRHFVFIVTIVAFVMNLAWEIIQMTWYENNVYDLLHVSFCALASVADVIMVLLIYLSFALVYKNAFWIKNINMQKALVLIFIGGIGAILAEMRHVSAGDWTYNDSMPLLPLVSVGLSPVLQFMMLPLVACKTSFPIF